MFWHRLALALGMSVRRCQQEITPEEFRSWIAYYRLSPFGAEREDLRIGQVAAMLGNIHRRKGARAFRADDFILYRPGQSGQRAKQSVGAMKTAMKAWANMQNARQARRAAQDGPQAAKG